MVMLLRNNKDSLVYILFRGYDFIVLGVFLKGWFFLLFPNNDRYSDNYFDDWIGLKKPFLFFFLKVI